MKDLPFLNHNIVLVAVRNCEETHCVAMLFPFPAEYTSNSSGDFLAQQML